MPTYAVYSLASAFTDQQRDALAAALTDLHSLHTGAPRSFVQTVFLDLAPAAHYVGAQRSDARSVWVYAHMRAGRPAETRTAIAHAVRDAVERIAHAPRQYVWVYLNELTHSDMIEFGSVLPPPGEERAWIDAMEPAIRDHLIALG